MPEDFKPGDNLVFQVESGFGLIRLLAVEAQGDDRIWHVVTFEDFYPDVEHAEAALLEPETLRIGIPHLALTNRAFERTPAAVLSNHPVTPTELKAYKDWIEKGRSEVLDRSIIQMLGLR